MKREWGSVVLIIFIIVAYLAFTLVRAQATHDAVDAKVSSLLNVSEKEKINIEILKQPIIEKIQDFRIFGSRPVSMPQSGRSNPFEGGS